MNIAEMLGLDERQRKLIDLAMWAESSFYKGQNLLPWTKDRRGILAVRCHEREPAIQVGIAEDKTERLLDMLVGEGRLPVFQGISDELLTLLLEDLEFVDSIFLPALDLVVKGSACFGFTRVENPDGEDFFEPLYRDPVFCKPIFASMAGSEDAKKLAEEWRRIGVPLEDPAEGEYLWVPPGTRSDDLIALRYEPAAYDPEKRETRRERIDYLPNVIIRWKRPATYDQLPTPHDWVPVTPYRPHNWGLIPLVWERSRSARPGETEGRSFLTPPLLSVAMAADYTESLRFDSVKASCWPLLCLIDLQDKNRAAAQGAQHMDPTRPYGRAYVMNTGPSGVLEFTTIGQQKQGTAFILEPSGKGLEWAKAQVKDLRNHADRITSIVDQDPENRGIGVLSGVALQKMFMPTISRINSYRRPIGRLVRKVAHKLAKVAEVPLVAPPKPGESMIERKDFALAWPSVFSSSPEDWRSALLALGPAAGDQAIVSRETAARLMSNVLELPSPEVEAERVMKEPAYPKVDADTASKVEIAKATPKPTGPFGGP